MDDERLRRAAALTGTSGSALLDRALTALIAAVETTREAEALERQPYEQDPDLAWSAPHGPDLPYHGDVPKDVIALARARRRSLRP